MSNSHVGVPAILDSHIPGSHRAGRSATMLDILVGNE